MISLKSEFKFWDRGFKETLVFIPGWATDYQIFNPLQFNYNYLLTVKLYPFNFIQPLLDKLVQENLDKVSLFGFSLGGFLAYEFASKYPEKTAQLILVSIRKGYEPKVLDGIKEQLWKNKQARLYKFYISCFSQADTAGLAWFKENLLEEYVSKITLNELTWGLDYFSNHKIAPEDLEKLENIRIFHGSDDSVAPIEEAIEIKSELPQAKFVYLAGLGHIPFLNPAFKESFTYG